MLFSPKSPLYVLRHHNYRLLFLGLFISRIGSEMQVIAINWQVYILTNSALSLGFIGLARFLPLMIFALFGGAAADIFNRRKIMLIAQFFMTTSTILLAYATLTHHSSPFLIYSVLIINSIASAFDTPARQSLVPLLVPKNEFIKAVGLNSTMWQAAIILGPSLGGFVIAYLGVGAVYVLNAISFIAVIIALLAIDDIKQKISTTLSFNTKGIKEGLSYVLKTPLIWSTMLLDFFATFFSSATVLMPIFAKDILAVGPQGLGFLYAAPALGAVTTGLILSSFHNTKNQGKLLIVAVCMYGVATILFGLSTSWYFSLFFLALTGVADIISAIIRNTIRQLATPNHIRGRMVSINMIFFMGGPQLGEVEAGLVAGMFNAPFAVVTGGIATLITTAAIVYLVPQLRHYKGHEHMV